MKYIKPLLFLSFLLVCDIILLIIFYCVIHEYISYIVLYVISYILSFVRNNIFGDKNIMVVSRVTFNIDKDVKMQIKELAVKKETTITDLCVDWIEKGLKKEMDLLK